MRFRMIITMGRLVRGAVSAAVLGIACFAPSTCSAQSSGREDLAELKADAEEFFKKRVTPFIKSYCLECHRSSRPTEAGLNFDPALDTPGHAAFSEKWKKAAARIEAHDMPPDGLKQPTDEERRMFSQWLHKVKYLSPKDPGDFVIRRLTKTEYGNTLRDLFGVDPQIADALPNEVSGAGYLNSISPLQLEQYLAITEEVLNQVLSYDGVPVRRAVPGTPDSQSVENPAGQDVRRTTIDLSLFVEPPTPGTDVQETVRKVAQLLAKKVYRRPASDPEVKVLMDVFELGRQNELSYQASLRLMLKAMLVSPQFLFITPADDYDTQAEIIPLDDYQLGSRLSYLLWGTMPDDELMSLADSGKLRDPAILKEQVTRMLKDPRSRSLFDGFGAQWLGTGDLKTKTFDLAKFPEMTSEMRSAMYDEVRLFFQSVVRENVSIAQFIDSDYTFLNENLATLYGLEEVVRGTEMRKVPLIDENRGGILGMPGVLAATSFPNRTSPVNRGVWVLEQVLGEHVPSAPPDVPALEKQDQKSVANLTLRERFEMHRSDPTCATCHRLLDPIGFGLENFDAIGRWRDQDDNGQPIDPTGELPDGSRFSNPQELKAMVAGRLEDFSRNLVEKMLAYALCRKLEGYDEIVVDELMQTLAQDGYRMQTLITEVVTSYPFTYRRTQ
jgi:mono/diheme cytochrome c family protein